MTFRFINSFDKWEERHQASLHKQVVRPGRSFASKHDLRHRTPEDLVQQRKRTSFDLAEEVVYVLERDWKVFSEYGFIVSPNDEIITESFSFPHEQEAKSYLKKKIESASLENEVHIDGGLFVFSNVGHDNYYHIISELLPRLEWYLPFKLSAKLLVMKDSPAYVIDALEKIGIGEDRIVWQEPDTCYSAEALITLPYALNFIPERFQFLKRSLQDSVVSVPKKQRAFFIDRSDESKRRFHKRKKLHKLFKKFDIEIVQAENYSLKKQIELFQSASHILGVHGAGLTNIMWQHRPRFLEFRPAGYPNKCFEHLGLALGARQLHIVEQSVREDDPKAMILTPQLDVIEEELSVFLEQQ